MKYTDEKLLLENASSQEWIITNGIGGFASSTILGVNTRRYHGLLIASLSTPGKRFLVLSKLDEAITVERKILSVIYKYGKKVFIKRI